MVFSAEQLFEFGPGLFDGVEIGRIGWQIEQSGTHGLHACSHALDLMNVEVVHHEDVADPQFGAEERVQEVQQDVAVGGGFDGHGRQHSGQRESAQDGQYLAVATRHRSIDAYASRSAPVAAGNLRRDPGFIEIYQMFRCDRANLRYEKRAPNPVFRRVSLTGVDRLFYDEGRVLSPPGRVAAR